MKIKIEVVETINHEVEIEINDFLTEDIEDVPLLEGMKHLTLFLEDIKHDPQSFLDENESNKYSTFDSWEYEEIKTKQD